MYCTECVSDATAFAAALLHNATVHLFVSACECVRSYICISVCPCFYVDVLCFSAPHCESSVSLYTLMMTRGCEMFFLSSIKHPNYILLMECDNVPFEQTNQVQAVL